MQPCLQGLYQYAPFLRCRWNLSNSAEWDGLSFPVHVLDSSPITTTYEKTLAFTRQGLSGPPASHSGAVPKALTALESGPWAAVVSAQLCTPTSGLLQHLDVRATPGTEVLLNGTVVARTTRRSSSVAAFPRGPPSATPFVRWASRGCDHIQLRMYDPPKCPAGHAESVLPIPEPSPDPLKELRIAHSNTSVILCASADCSESRKFPIGADVQQLVVHVSWRDNTLQQSVGYIDADGNQHAPAEWVRIFKRSFSIFAYFLLMCSTVMAGYSFFSMK